MYQVSILVPIYNVELYIERCVRSLMEQSYSNIQYVFVDDCSPDKSLDILKKVVSEYPEREKNVMIISHDHNRGLSAARNTAVENATGIFLCHVDSDDYIEPDAIENLVLTQQKEDADIVNGLAIKETDDYNVIMELREYSDKKERIKDVISPTLRHTIWGRLIRKCLYTNFSIKAKEGINIGEDAQVTPCLFYYANVVSNCYRLVYHYNCQNENSYVHEKGELNKLCRIAEQTADSYYIVRSFFEKKDVVYYNEAEKSLSKYLQILMDCHVRLRDKKSFERVRSIYKCLNCGKVMVGPWHLIHNITGYSYWYCRITNMLLSPFFKKMKNNFE